MRLLSFYLNIENISPFYGWPQPYGRTESLEHRLLDQIIPVVLQKPNLDHQNLDLYKHGRQFAQSMHSQIREIVTAIIRKILLICKWIGPNLEMHDLTRCALSAFTVPDNFLPARPSRRFEAGHPSGSLSRPPLSRTQAAPGPWLASPNLFASRVSVAGS
jgi:hypothetical protein